MRGVAQEHVKHLHPCFLLMQSGHRIDKHLAMGLQLEPVPSLIV